MYFSSSFSVKLEWAHGYKTKLPLLSNSAVPACFPLLLSHPFFFVISSPVTIPHLCSSPFLGQDNMENSHSWGQGWYVRVLPSLPTAPYFSTTRIYLWTFVLISFYQSPDKAPLVFYPVQPLIYIPSACLSILRFNFLPCLITPLIWYLQLNVFCLPLFLPLSFFCPFLSELFVHH